MTQKTTEILFHHALCCSEELILIALFLDKVSDGEKEALTEKIGSHPSQTLPIKKPSLPPLSSSSLLCDFVGPRSIIFQLLGESHTFLAKQEWQLLPLLEDIRRSLKNLFPINDSCERALALATRLNGAITRDEDSWQELVKVVDAQQKMFPTKTKKDLKKFL